MGSGDPRRCAPVPSSDSMSMTTSSPQRKTNPESIPAVAPAAMDAAFFARLRVLDEVMFLSAASASALRGRLEEVSHALSTFRPDCFEPLLWGEHEKINITMPQHPMAALLSEHASKSHLRVQDMWGAVALALASHTSGWNVKTDVTFAFCRDGRDSSPFDAARQAANEELLDQAIRLCSEQAARKYGDEVPFHIIFTGGGDEDEISSRYGPRPWTALLTALSKSGCQWVHLDKVVDAIPMEVIEKNPQDYRALIRELVHDGNVPPALRLAKRSEPLQKHLIDISAYGSIGTRDEHSIITHLPSAITGTGDERQRALCVDAALELMDLAFKQQGQPEVSYLDALQRMLPSLVAEKTVPSNGQAAPSSEPQLKMLHGLIARIDDAFGTTPVDAWPTAANEQLSSYGQDKVMTRALHEALRTQQAFLVDKLRLHWSVDHAQVNLLKVVDGLHRLETVDGDTQNAILSILTTAQRVGIDLNVPVSGEDPTVQWRSKNEKPALILHTIGKATKDKGGQLELMQGMVRIGIDPTIADKRGWKAEVFLDTEAKPEWRELVRVFGARQRANDAIGAIMAGLPPPKRRRAAKVPSL